MDIKKVCAIVFMIAMFSGLVSAGMEWDNVADYKDNDMTVVVTNWLGLGEKLGEATLISHKTPDEIRYVGSAGKDKAVMFYDFNDWEFYKDGLGEVIFTDMRTGQQIERDYYFAEAVYEEQDVMKYQKVCPKDAECYKQEIGTQKEMVFIEWKKLPTNDIPDHNVTIALITDVLPNDYIDGVWTIAGKKVSRHSTWTDSLNVGLISYYNGSSQIEQVQGGDFNLTIVAGDPVSNSAGGKIAGCYDFDGSADQYNIYETDQMGLNQTSAFTISFWTINDASGSQANLGDENDDWYVYRSGAGNIQVEGITGANLVSGTANTGTYYNVVVRLDSNNVSLWLNSVVQDDGAFTGFDGTISKVAFGEGFGTVMDGRLDEIGFWNRSLTDAEIVDLYNGGTGISRDEWSPDVSPPDINITSPINNSVNSNETLYVEYTRTDATALGTCWYSNGTYKINKTLASCGNITGLTWPEGITHNLTIWANDTGGYENHSQVFFTISINPDLNITWPNNNSFFTKNTVDINYTVSDNDAVQSCWWSNNSGKENNTLTCGQNITDPVWYDGIHNITVWANDSLNNVNVSRVTFTVDGTAPTISQAYNLTNQTVFAFPYNSTWNYTVSDAINLESCWYNTTDDATITLTTCNSTVYTQWASQGYKTIWYYVNDTSGNENHLFKTISIDLLTSETSHDPETIGELGTVNFELYVNRSIIPTTTAYLFVNNTVYYPDTTRSFANYTYFNYSLTVPFGWGNTTGLEHNYYWNYSVDGIGKNYSTTLDNFTVYTMAIGNCTDYGKVILNWSLYDEEQNAFNVTGAVPNVELDLQISKGDASWTYNNTWAYNNGSVCIPYGVLNNTNYTIDLTFGFDMSDHVNEFYYLDQGTLSNDGTSFNDLTDNEITLMDLLTADSTSFLFNYFDEDGLIEPDIIVHVFRKYIGEGLFREVERAKQNDDGNTVVHLVEEDVIYYFIISQNGTTLFTSSTYTALCQSSPCTIQLEESGGFQEFETDDWDLIEDGYYSLTQNSADRTVNLTYSLTSSSTMNLTVYTLVSDGSYSSVASEESTGTSGSIEVTLPVISGNTSFFATIYQDGEFKKSQWIDFEEDAGLYFGNTLSLFLGALIIMALGLMAVAEGGVATIIFLILGMFVSMVLGLVDYRTSTGLNILIYFIIAGAIIVWKLTRRTR